MVTAALCDVATSCSCRLYEEIAGVTVRLYKYLFNDYFDEFVASINKWITGSLRMLLPHQADPDSQAEMMKLRKIYTCRVVPDALIKLWNNGFRTLSYIVGEGEDPVADRPRVVARMVQIVFIATDANGNSG